MISARQTLQYFATTLLNSATNTARIRALPNAFTEEDVAQALFETIQELVGDAAAALINKGHGHGGQ